MRMLKFVAMYHVSMSGNGLHIYYFYQIPNSGLTPQVYQQAFIQGNECIGKAIPAEYDAAVGKANHGSSFCHDPEAWFNPDAEPFKVDMTLSSCKRNKNDRITNDKVFTEKDWTARWTVEKVFAYAQKCVDNSSTGEFAPGHRNNYLVRLAMMLSDFGMEQQHAAQLMSRNMRRSMARSRYRRSLRDAIRLQNRCTAVGLCLTVRARMAKARRAT